MALLVLIVMKRFGYSVISAFKRYPFSVSAYILTMLLWAFIYFGQINIKLNPAPEGISDYRGEGIMYGVLLVMLLSAILLVIMVLNVIVQRNKSFYVKLSAVIVISNLLLYGMGMIL